jgi:four helix bundle protein
VIVKSYIALEDLEVYKLSRQLSKSAWVIYDTFDWRTKKILGDQFIESVDSIGANTAEGYGRFHYLEKVKFYYNARGSLFEAKHWAELLYERKLITQKDLKQFVAFYEEILLTLNGLIRSTMRNKISSLKS